MSNITKAYDTIKLAGAQEGVGGVGGIAQRIGMNVDTARRLMRNEPEAVKKLRRLESEAIKILDARGT